MSDCTVTKSPRPLTAAQRAGLEVLSRGTVEWTPGEKPGGYGGSIRRDVLRRLEQRGLALTFGLHPWGPYPVYAASITDAGRDALSASGESRS